MIKIISEGCFIYFIVAILKLKHTFNKFDKYVFFFKNDNKLNELSYNFDHTLIYIMCKCHDSTTFHWFVFSPESQPSRMQRFAKICHWKPPPVLHMSYMIYFYYQDIF